MERSSPDHPASLADELARERNREAADRAPIARHLAIVMVFVGMAAMGLILVRF